MLIFLKYGVLVFAVIVHTAFKAHASFPFAVTVNHMCIVDPPDLNA